MTDSSTREDGIYYYLLALDGDGLICRNDTLANALDNSTSRGGRTIVKAERFADSDESYFPTTAGRKTRGLRHVVADDNIGRFLSANAVSVVYGEPSAWLKAALQAANRA